ncbi:MAG: hypothetical protein ACLFV7_14675 [Phycisphaerae bacterium]
MNMRLRQLARSDPDVFHFVGSFLRLRAGSTGWSCIRELSRLWHRTHQCEL